MLSGAATADHRGGDRRQHSRPRRLASSRPKDAASPPAARRGGAAEPVPPIWCGDGPRPRRPGGAPLRLPRWRWRAARRWMRRRSPHWAADAAGLAARSPTCPRRRWSPASRAIWERLSPVGPGRRRREGRLAAAALACRGRGRLIGGLSGDLLIPLRRLGLALEPAAALERGDGRAGDRHFGPRASTGSGHCGRRHLTSPLAGDPPAAMDPRAVDAVEFGDRVASIPHRDHRLSGRCGRGRSGPASPARSVRGPRWPAGGGKRGGAAGPSRLRRFRAVARPPLVPVAGQPEDEAERRRDHQHIAVELEGGFESQGFARTGRGPPPMTSAVIHPRR